METSSPCMPTQWTWTRWGTPTNVWFVGWHSTTVRSTSVSSAPETLSPPFPTKSPFHSLSPSGSGTCWGGTSNTKNKQAPRTILSSLLASKGSTWHCPFPPPLEQIGSQDAKDVLRTCSDWHSVALNFFLRSLPRCCGNGCAGNRSSIPVHAVPSGSGIQSILLQTRPHRGWLKDPHLRLGNVSTTPSRFLPVFAFCSSEWSTHVAALRQKVLSQLFSFMSCVHTLACSHVAFVMEHCSIFTWCPGTSVLCGVKAVFLEQSRGMMSSEYLLAAWGSVTESYRNVVQPKSFEVPDWWVTGGEVC